MNTISLGNFSVTSGKIMVTDPIYLKGTWCQAEMHVSNGSWKAEVVEDDGQVKIFQVIFGDLEIPKKDWVLNSQEIGVDSGFIGMYDNDTYDNAQDDGREFHSINERTIITSRFGGTFVSGAICDPGQRNNNFNLYVAEDAAGKVVGLRVKF